MSNTRYYKGLSTGLLVGQSIGWSVQPSVGPSLYHLQLCSCIKKTFLDTFQLQGCHTSNQMLFKFSLHPSISHFSICQINRWTEGVMSGWMNGQINGRMNGPTDGQMGQQSRILSGYTNGLTIMEFCIQKIADHDLFGSLFKI